MHTRIEEFINKKSAKKTLNIHTPGKFLNKHSMIPHQLTCQTIIT